MSSLFACEAPMLAILLALLAALSLRAAAGQHLDNRDTCAHRVRNCRSDVDHFETKVEMRHTSTISRFEYRNTSVLLEQAWPSRGPWMTATSQRVVFVRCGCPVPAVPPGWESATVIHVPAKSVVVQMAQAVGKVYLLGQRARLAAVESAQWVTATPELLTDIRDGSVRMLDRAADGQPSPMLTVSFQSGTFASLDSGFRLELVNCTDGSAACTLASTACIRPAADASAANLTAIVTAAFGPVQQWGAAGKLWVLATGSATATPRATLTYSLLLDDHLPASVSVRGTVAGCGGGVQVNVVRSAAPSSWPIYHRLADLEGGFPDVLITDPRALGPLADDPRVSARRFLDSDPGEATALGRAELIKLTALIAGAEDTGNTVFELIEKRYMRAKERAFSARRRPTVMVGKPGTWNQLARESWMITVGSTYVGQLLRDANAEYRNADDSVNHAVCGSGCGLCPSGPADTRCSVPIQQFLDLFRWADYWISAGVGANCWSGSCDFRLTADSLLSENRDVYSQFLAMRCGSVLALDKAHTGAGNPYWEVGRLRPDLVLEDLVVLLHPDVRSPNDTTTFFRELPQPADMTGVQACPRTLLPARPEPGALFVVASFPVHLGSPQPALVGRWHFAVLDRLYTGAHSLMAEQLETSAANVDVALSNDDLEGAPIGSSFELKVTVRVPNCAAHRCDVPMGTRLAAFAGPMKQALALDWIEVRQHPTRAVDVLDAEGDIIPLGDLVPSASEGDSILGIVLAISGGALLLTAVVAALTYKFAFAKGGADVYRRIAKDGAQSYAMSHA